MEHWHLARQRSQFCLAATTVPFAMVTCAGHPGDPACAELGISVGGGEARRFPWPTDAAIAKESNI